ncbi:MAG: hypothetical protein IJ680_04740 [Paludibacteraceae bacterium]|nr:hypothetical protein [Paludibacteraceae bacterium]
MKKIPPLIKAQDIDDKMAIEVIENAIFSMSMNDNLDNQTLCLLAAMRRGRDALQREQARKEQGHD